MNPSSSHFLCLREEAFAKTAVKNLKTETKCSPTYFSQSILKKRTDFVAFEEQYIDR